MYSKQYYVDQFNYSFLKYSYCSNFFSVQGNHEEFLYTFLVIFNEQLGVNILYSHILQHDRLQVCEEPLLNVTGTLRGILHNLCQVMEIQGLLAKVDNGSDLNAILEQNILDTCQWVGSHSYICRSTHTSSLYYNMNSTIIYLHFISI